MGLTIHYSIKSRARKHERVVELVEKMRQLAMDLPFEEVGDLKILEGDACDFNKSEDQELRWLLIQAGKSVTFPWNSCISTSVSPNKVVAFKVVVGPGSEPANLGLCRYPETIELDYVPEDDQKFYRNGRFSFDKWYAWVGNRNIQPKPYCDTKEKRTVQTKLRGWLWSSFCKTQYASAPACGGVANFLRCHISVITLLEKIGKLPTISLDLDDEGKYGPSTYSDDWKEAYAAKRKPTYVPHEGQYSPKSLVEEIGEWNSMIAAFAGGLNDAIGQKCEAPIFGFSNFEQLEFRGHNHEHVKQFVEKMAEVANLKQETEND